MSKPEQPPEPEKPEYPGAILYISHYGNNPHDYDPDCPECQAAEPSTGDDEPEHKTRRPNRQLCPECDRRTGQVSARECPIHGVYQVPRRGKPAAPQTSAPDERERIRAVIRQGWAVIDLEGTDDQEADMERSVDAILALIQATKVEAAIAELIGLERADMQDTTLEGYLTPRGLDFVQDRVSKLELKGGREQ